MQVRVGLEEGSVARGGAGEGGGDGWGGSDGAGEEESSEEFVGGEDGDVLGLEEGKQER